MGGWEETKPTCCPWREGRGACGGLGGWADGWVGGWVGGRRDLPCVFGEKSVKLVEVLFRIAALVAEDLGGWVSGWVGGWVMGR